VVLSGVVVGAGITASDDAVVVAFAASVPFQVDVGFTQYQRPGVKFVQPASMAGLIASKREIDIVWLIAKIW